MNEIGRLSEQISPTNPLTRDYLCKCKTYAYIARNQDRVIFARCDQKEAQGCPIKDDIIHLSSQPTVATRRGSGQRTGVQITQPPSQIRTLKGGAAVLVSHIEDTEEQVRATLGPL